MTLENLVLGGIRVVGGVKTMLVREGSKQGHVQTSASLSHPRHLSPSWPMTDYQAESRRDLFDEEAAIRAGRSVSFAGVPVCPAVKAGRAIPKRWPLVEGGPCSTAVRRFGRLAKTRASEANELPAYCVRGSVLATFSRIGAEGGMKHSPLSKQAPKHGKARLAWPMPADAMPSTSTRGA
jgi:hypothetical protein